MFAVETLTKLMRSNCLDHLSADIAPDFTTINSTMIEVQVVCKSPIEFHQVTVPIQCQHFWDLSYCSCLVLVIKKLVFKIF